MPVWNLQLVQPEDSCTNSVGPCSGGANTNGMLNFSVSTAGYALPLTINITSDTTLAYYGTSYNAWTGALATGFPTAPAPMIIPGSESVTYKYQGISPGSYTLTITDGNGCSTTLPNLGFDMMSDNPSYPGTQNWTNTTHPNGYSGTPYPGATCSPLNETSNPTFNATAAAANPNFVGNCMFGCPDASASNYCINGCDELNGVVNPDHPMSAIFQGMPDGNCNY